MRKSFLLIAILAAVMIFPFAINVDKADADAIMFPWITKSATVSTLVSVVNTAQGNPDFEERIHLQYWVKSAAGAHPDSAPDFVNDPINTCSELDFKVIVSKDDMFTVDTSGKVGNGAPLFGDLNTQPVSVASLKMNVPDPRRAYLIVDNNTAQNFAALGNNEDGTLYGEAIVLELGSGAAWGYVAYNPSGGQESTQSYPVTFEDGSDMLGEVIGAGEVTQTTLMPIDTMTTRFFLTPVDVADQGDHSAANQRVGNANAKVALCIDPPDDGDTTSGCDEGGVFDNEEGPVSSSANPNVVCTAGINLQTLLGEGYDSFKDGGFSGWAYVVTNMGDVDQTGLIGAGAPTVDNPTSEMIIGRLEYTDTNLVLDGFDVGGAVNNFVWLRDSYNGRGSGGINNIHNVPFTAAD